MNNESVVDWAWETAWRGRGCRTCSARNRVLQTLPCTGSYSYNHSKLNTLSRKTWMLQTAHRMA